MSSTQNGYSVPHSPIVEQESGSERIDGMSRDIVVALIRAGTRLVSVQNTDPEAIGGMYGRLFNAVRHTIKDCV